MKRMIRSVKACVIATAVTMTLLSPPTMEAQQILSDDPLEKMPPPMHVDDAKFRKLNDFYDLFLNTFGKPAELQPKPKKRKELPLIPAQAVNTLGEVPDNEWFTNRIGSHPMSVEELVRGPGNENAPSMEGPWTVVAAKTEGVTPGFRIRDSKGRNYLLKFDPVTNPEMATGADVVGSLLFHALGYNVPQNYLVHFDPENLVISEKAKIKDRTGKDRRMSHRDVTVALMRVPRREDGMIRAVASLFLPGKILGEFRYHGTRADDPNDTVRHEHRRDLRGLFVACAWLNHNDSRAINTLDSLVEENGIKFVKHYLIDFGAILGSASVYPNTARDGNVYLYEFKPAMAQILTLGLYVPDWARSKYSRRRSLGLIEYPRFEPEEWKPNYPNPAFSNRLPDDTFWAAKKIMSFSDEQLRAVVRKAEYSDPKADELLVKYLILRRDTIGKTYFAKVLPLDKFAVREGKLEFEDLENKYGFREPRQYQVEWSRFDNQAGSHSPIPNAAGVSLPPEVNQSPEGSYFGAKIRGQDQDKTVTVIVRKRSDGVQVVGIDRTW